MHRLDASAKIGNLKPVSDDVEEIELVPLEAPEGADGEVAGLLERRRGVPAAEGPAELVEHALRLAVGVEEIACPALVDLVRFWSDAIGAILGLDRRDG